MTILKTMNKFFSMVNSLDFNWYVGIISKYIHLENIDFNNYFSEILSHTQLIKIRFFFTIKYFVIT